MKYINVNSHRGIVNLFADYVLKSIVINDKIDATIEVTDCGKFFIVNGLTNAEKVVDINEVKMVFIEENKDLLKSFGYEHINVIDTITYGVELTRKEEYWFTYYNSTRPIYYDGVMKLLPSIEDIKYMSVSDDLFIELDYEESKTDNLGYFTYSPLNISSEFPYGYSFNMGRGLLYYGEYITNQLFGKFLTDKFEFKLSLRKNDEDDFDIELLSNCLYSEKDLVSMILDNFNFDLNHFKTMLKDYNYMDDLLKPMEVKPWMVKDKKKGLIIF